MTRRLLLDKKPFHGGQMSFPSGSQFGVVMLYITIYINGQSMGYISTNNGASVYVKPGDVVRFTNHNLDETSIYIDGVEHFIGCGSTQITIQDHIPQITGYKSDGVSCP